MKLIKKAFNNIILLNT